MVEITRTCPDCREDAPCITTSTGRVQIRCKATRGHNGCGYIGTSNLFYSGKMIEAAEAADAAEADGRKETTRDAIPEPLAESDDGVQPGQSEKRTPRPKRKPEPEPERKPEPKRRRSILLGGGG